MHENQLFHGRNATKKLDFMLFLEKVIFAPVKMTVIYGMCKLATNLKCITSHTARRSGATNLYKLGVLSDQEIRSITGHQSQKVFESYIRIGISEQAQRVGDKILAARKAKETQVDK